MRRTITLQLFPLVTTELLRLFSDLDGLMNVTFGLWDASWFVEHKRGSLLCSFFEKTKKCLGRTFDWRGSLSNAREFGAFGHDGKEFGDEVSS